MIWTYNRIVKYKNHIKFSKQNIDVQLKKRFEALPNIATTVKKYLSHENEIHTKITKLRSNYTTTTGSEKIAVENQLSKLLGNLSISFENYPELKSNDSVIHLQRSINEFAEQISASQRAYNNSVLTYNDAISTFPSNIIASIFGFKEEIYLKIISDEQERENPNINNLL
ncbi:MULTISPECIES: LemA family protein [unclassified Cellulophaga]|uniref:LemA family protein n=1 Tax=unclassified Cellulophaga TaxID=2634405 RepID=UPI0026E2D8FA|nr:MULTISPECIES: LemA family protein [unclassified Cellulophaga]MDO6490665.1 LemA family protein [Cellulophaga sp. 2_MG-2023]MDO6494141.1 LemA family protein [Cellulophaga sp. 3_MG-2023]